MSIHWGYVCESHAPHLESERWFNHGEEVLTLTYQLERDGLWPNDPAFTSWEEPTPVVGSGYATTAPILWLRKHPHCVVSLRSEYGDVVALS